MEHQQMALSQGSSLTILNASAAVSQPFKKTHSRRGAESRCSWSTNWAAGGRSMRPLGSSKASEPMKEWPEKRMMRGSWRLTAACTSARPAAGSTAMCTCGTARSKCLSSCPSCSGRSWTGELRATRGLEKSASSSTCCPRICRTCVLTFLSSTKVLTKHCRSKRFMRRTAASTSTSATAEMSTQSTMKREDARPCTRSSSSDHATCTPVWSVSVRLTFDWPRASIWWSTLSRQGVEASVV
mmetsp:Transcript_4843/g.11026  ORF Transcript_4843/g.11026 Transcript_4843/m.11026 type:complete len:241 (+) Transcript_4843:702-1424(+)